MQVFQFSGLAWFNLICLRESENPKESINNLESIGWKIHSVEKVFQPPFTLIETLNNDM